MNAFSHNQDKEYFLCMIMPAKNVEKYVYEAIVSYISHDRDDILLIVIDDHSSDNTFNICSQLQSENSSKILLIKCNKLWLFSCQCILL